MFLLLRILSVCLLVATAPLAAAPLNVNETEIEIYASLINHGLSTDVPIVVISAETTGDPAAIGSHDDTPASVEELGAPAETLSNWRMRNQQIHSIDHPLDLKVSYQMIDRVKREKLFMAEQPALGWDRFFATYSGAPGLIRLSKVGFDASLEHALVYIEHHCGSVCGSGRLAYLNFADKRWQVRGAQLIWMVE